MLLTRSAHPWGKLHRLHRSCFVHLGGEQGLGIAHSSEIEEEANTRCNAGKGNGSHSNGVEYSAVRHFPLSTLKLCDLSI